MPVERKWIGLCWLMVVGCGLALTVLNLYWGDLNQDEGWYLYAAREVAQGRLPYRDFAFTQGPLLPLVYSFAARLVSRYGLAAGRVVTAGVGWLSAMLAALLAARLSRPGTRGTAALIAFALAACNVYQSYFTTVVKTYALTALFLMLGIVALASVTRRAGVLWAFAAGVFMALSAGTRLSAGAALPVAGLYLLLLRRRLGDGRWLAFGVGGVLGLLAWAGPFAHMAPEGFRFAMFEYHTGRVAGSLLSGLIYKAGFVSRMVQAYFVGALAILTLVAWNFASAEKSNVTLAENAPPVFNGFLWAVVAAVTLTHFAAPFPYEDYQVFIWPVAAAAIAVALVGRVVALGEREPATVRGYGTWLAIVMTFANVAASFSSPLNQSWFVRGRDRIWWPLKEQSPIRQLREIAVGLAEFAWLDGVLLTQDTYLAVEADMDVPRGMELGPFCYFPDMERRRAERLHVLNRDMLRELLRSARAPVAAFSEYGLSIRCPEVAPLSEAEQRELRALLEQRYQLLCEVPYFGQAHTTLRVYVRRREPMVRNTP